MLPGDSTQVLDPDELPALAVRVGHDIVTSDGTTLLGADDKAGIAEIMAAVAYLARHPERPRATIRVAFTVDEEVGRGAEDFDLEAFGADVAYTLDGSDLGELEIETFSATSIRVTIRGLSVHPGSGEGKARQRGEARRRARRSRFRATGSPRRRRRIARATSIRTGSREARRRRSSTSSLATTTTSSSSSTSRSCASSHRACRGARAAREGRDRGARLVPEHAPVHRGEPARRRGGARGDPPGRSRAARSRSRAAARTARCSRRRDFRRRTSSPAGRSTTRCASGRACRTWPPRLRRIVELAGVWAEPTD